MKLLKKDIVLHISLSVRVCRIFVYLSCVYSEKSINLIYGMKDKKALKEFNLITIVPYL